MISFIEYLNTMIEVYGRRRDETSKAYGKFRSKGLRKLRDVMLSEGIDIATILDDSNAPWNAGACSELGDIVFWRRGGQGGIAVDDLELIDILKDRKDRAKETMKRLKEAYYTALSSVSEIDVSRASLRWARIASILAFASLAVATVSLLTVTYSDNSVLAKILSFFGQ